MIVNAEQQLRRRFYQRRLLHDINTIRITAREHGFHLDKRAHAPSSRLPGSHTREYGPSSTQSWTRIGCIHGFDWIWSDCSKQMMQFCVIDWPSRLSKMSRVYCYILNIARCYHQWVNGRLMSVFINVQPWSSFLSFYRQFVEWIVLDVNQNTRELSWIGLDWVAIRRWIWLDWILRNGPLSTTLFQRPCSWAVFIGIRESGTSFHRCAVHMLRGGSAVGRWTCDLQVAGSIPGRWLSRNIGQLSLASLRGSLNRVPALAGGKGGILTSVGWRATLCDPIWHVSFP